MSLLSHFGGAQIVRGSLRHLLGSLEHRLAVPISIGQIRTRIMPPPYRDKNAEEKEMNRLQGISDCPRNCLCSNNIEITYKNTRLLTQFVSQQTGCILPRAITKLCIKKQHRIAKEIKKARTMAYMPYTESLMKYHVDPRLFNITRSNDEMYLQMRVKRDKRVKYQPYKINYDS